MPTPCAFRSPMTRKSRSTSLSLSEAVGSSMIRMRASAPRARAISTSCCSGIVSRRTSVSGSMVAPIFASKLSRPRAPLAPADTRASRRRARARGRCSRRPSGPETGPAAGRSRRSPDSRAGPGSMSPTGRPWTSIVPSSGRWAPVITLISVDLPGAVLADQGVDFPGPQVERDPLQGLHAGKRLADPVSLSNVATGSFVHRRRLSSARCRGSKACGLGGPLFAGIARRTTSRSYAFSLESLVNRSLKDCQAATH